MSKENIKNNVVEAPTLFIGVGGTGGRIVKRVADLCRPGETENVNFLCLDTNVNDLNNVAKSDKKIYYVQTSNTQTVGNYLDYDNDALRNWFPKNAVLYDKTVSEGAGQVRAISRLAFNACIKTGKIRPLYDSIDDLFRKTGKAMKQAMRVVIVSTASGGTGSGIALPLSMFVRDYVKTKYPNTSLIVRSLILLPETLDSVIDSTVERESQRRNAYATIKEINAFMMKGSGFFDIEDSLKRYNSIHVDIPVAGSGELKPLSLLPFDFCFLLDGQNAEDSTMVSTKQYEIQAAQSLYEQNIGPMQKAAFSVEDNIIKEMSNPGNYGRNRFGGIGAGVIKYPYEDVADYIAYDWAMDSIGGEGEASKWTRYDKEFETAVADAKKKGLSSSEQPTRADVYCSKLQSLGDNFSKDLRATYIGDATKRINAYFAALANRMHEVMRENPMIRASMDAANDLAEPLPYKSDASIRGKSTDNLGALRDMETAIIMNTPKLAQNEAESIFNRESKTINEKAPYTLEALMTNSFGEICHPNAARFMLYKVETELTKRIRNVESEIETKKNSLSDYEEGAYVEGKFEVDFNGKKNRETSLDDLCRVETEVGADPGLFEKFKGYEKTYDVLNSCFTDYYSLCVEYGELLAERECYKIGLEYVREYGAQYLKFFGTFKEKMAALKRKQEDLLDIMAFKAGDSIYNVCVSKDTLAEMSLATKSRGSASSMLDKELNGQIFDAVKQNAVFEREARFMDVIEEDRRVDIFDDILLGYFKNSVRRECPDIDKNVIEAIAYENRLNARIKMRAQAGDEKGALVDNVTQDSNERYIREMIKKGENLAAPGIQRIVNEESREVRLCAYNQKLLEMRNFRVSELMPKGIATDTVSKYELHFFNALYNLTPDKLNKFASPLKTETGVKNAGLYHNAYVSYSKHIGPDSTKNMLISTHIDKRWDSISSMPEIDLDYQSRRILKIHKAMVYGLVFKAIVSKELSTVSSKSRPVYRYENSQERLTELVVSNGTLCDEFYEILDALYQSSAIVEDIDIIKAKNRAQDLVGNNNYVDTKFHAALEKFELHNWHEGRTSLFEIPLYYYISLPNSQRFISELTDMVNAIIEVFNEELTLWEQESDKKFLLCDILEEQFDLMAANYDKIAAHKNLSMADNPVVEIINRKIRNIMCASPEPDDYELIISEMEKKIHG